MIKKRITALTKLVSQFDDSFILQFDEDQRAKYLETLDIETLGSMKEIIDMPTIFNVKPLKSEYEYLINGGEIDPWHIFATHIESIDYFELDDGEKLEFEKSGILKDKHHNDLPARVIQDIAHMIVALANQTGSEVFFTQSAASFRYSQALKIKDASRNRAEIARMAGVKSSGSGSETSTQ
jgi:hypothetical protein